MELRSTQRPVVGTSARLRGVRVCTWGRSFNHFEVLLEPQLLDLQRAQIFIWLGVGRALRVFAGGVAIGREADMSSRAQTPRSCPALFVHNSYTPGVSSVRCLFLLCALLGWALAWLQRDGRTTAARQLLAGCPMQEMGDVELFSSRRVQLEPFGIVICQ